MGIIMGITMGITMAIIMGITMDIIAETMGTMGAEAIAENEQKLKEIIEFSYDQHFLVFRLCNSSVFYIIVSYYKYFLKEKN